MKWQVKFAVLIAAIAGVIAISYDQSLVTVIAIVIVGMPVGYGIIRLSELIVKRLNL